MVLGKLPVLGRPANLDFNRARASALAVGAGGLDIFLSSISSLISPSLWDTTPYRLKYCLKGPFNQHKDNGKSPYQA